MFSPVDPVPFYKGYTYSNSLLLYLVKSIWIYLHVCGFIFIYSLDDPLIYLICGLMVFMFWESFSCSSICSFSSLVTPVTSLIDVLLYFLCFLWSFFLISFCLFILNFEYFLLIYFQPVYKFTQLFLVCS